MEMSVKPSRCRAFSQKIGAMEHRVSHVLRYLWIFFLDFSNVFKSFVGSNFLSSPFAFKSSGLLVCLQLSFLTLQCLIFNASWVWWEFWALLQ